MISFRRCRSCFFKTIEATAPPAGCSMFDNFVVPVNSLSSIRDSSVGRNAKLHDELSEQLTTYLNINDTVRTMVPMSYYGP